jgi:hypothetical protein
MVTPLNESFDRVYTKENLTPVVAGNAASEEAFGRESHAEDYAALAGVTFTESPFEKLNSCVYHSKKKRINVQHCLQATAVIIGIHRF